MQSVQERYAPHNACFGCGPANARGLRLRSFPSPAGDDSLLAEWQAQAHHEAFEGILNGGIVGALLDCHSNWAAACFLKQRDELQQPPCTVTAEFHVKMQAPTPSDQPLELIATPVWSERSKVRVEASIRAGGRVTATCTGLFIAVKPGHPAYHRW